MLSAPDPKNQGRDVKVADVLDAAAKGVGNVVGPADDRSIVRRTLGRVISRWV